VPFCNPALEENPLRTVSRPNRADIGGIATWAKQKSRRKTLVYGWQDSYSVGVQAFDNAHKQLFAYCNEYYLALQSGKSTEHIADILNKTYFYTKQHFDSEEKWLASKGDPELAAHREQHRKFQKQIEQLISENKAGKIGLSGAVSKALREWLSGHIMATDQGYAARLHTKELQH
jgi:hemerythrin-like metal-binding protein